MNVYPRCPIISDALYPMRILTLACRTSGRVLLKEVVVWQLPDDIAMSRRILMSALMMGQESAYSSSLAELNLKRHSFSFMFFARHLTVFFVHDESRMYNIVFIYSRDIFCYRMLQESRRFLDSARTNPTDSTIYDLRKRIDLHVDRYPYFLEEMHQRYALAFIFLIV